MEDNKIRKIRFYCPEHEKGFEIEATAEIYCQTGKHYLASEFPPSIDYLEYCCGCQRFIPFSITGQEKSVKCSNCERITSKRYFCHNCQTLTSDVKKKVNEKQYKISGKGKVLPNCPACGIESEDESLYLHKCEVIKTEFYTSRETCEFCHTRFHSTNLPVIVNSEPPVVKDVKLSDESTAVLVSPNFFEVKATPNVQPIADEEEITLVRSKNDFAVENIFPKNVENKPEESQAGLSKDNQKIQKKSASSLIGCFVILIGIVGFVIIFAINEINNGFPNKNVSNNSNSLTQKVNTATPTPSVNINANSVNNSPSKKPKSFRGNSTIVLTGAALRDQPEDFEDVTVYGELDTKVRVIDRKGAKSAWFKIKTESGDEGWIHGDYIDFVDWNSLPCDVGDTGFISGGNLRSSPKHSVKEANILAIWNEGSKVKILDIEKGEASAKLGNPYWLRLEVLDGTCSLDVRTSNFTNESCESYNIGYMNSYLVDCD
ncbi:MAG TPA: SH3 domain-containing protein [Pyrinomonadaceae bacterium]|nr:SH3 domain-containing protein [Pyrinomonadaceae bacterium]